jgi:predicted RNA-binding protein YlqC (UPF0109 family)
VFAFLLDFRGYCRCGTMRGEACKSPAKSSLAALGGGEGLCGWFANTQQIGLESAVMEELLGTDGVDTVATDPRDAEVGTMLRAVLRSLVDVVDELEIVPLADAAGVSFQVHAAAEDMGKLIGKSGRTARAIRTILSGNAAKAGRRYSVDFRRKDERVA